MLITYVINVKVDSLNRASTLLKLLEENGYEDVSMDKLSSEEDSLGGRHAEWARSTNAFGRFNELILASLFRAGATNQKGSVTIEEIIENMKGLSGGREMLEKRGEGVVSRTISMVASAVLGNKYGWVGNDDSEPRRYWLTETGLEHTGIISKSPMHNHPQMAKQEEEEQEIS